MSLALCIQGIMLNKKLAGSFKMKENESLTLKLRIQYK